MIGLGPPPLNDRPLRYADDNGHGTQSHIDSNKNTSIYRPPQWHVSVLYMYSLALMTISLVISLFPLLLLPFVIITMTITSSSSIRVVSPTVHS